MEGSAADRDILSERVILHRRDNRNLNKRNVISEQRPTSVREQRRKVLNRLKEMEFCLLEGQRQQAISKYEELSDAQDVLSCSQNGPSEGLLSNCELVLKGGKE